MERTREQRRRSNNSNENAVAVEYEIRASKPGSPGLVEGEFDLEHDARDRAECLVWAQGYAKATIFAILDNGERVIVGTFKARP